MKVGNFEEMYLAELQELVSVEAQFFEASPAMLERVYCADLKEAIQSYAAECRGHCRQLGSILREHGAAENVHRDASMQTILNEANKWAAMVDKPELRDAGLIASVQRMVHYQIAVYGSMATWAGQLAFESDVQTLLKALNEKKRMDVSLTAIGKEIVNPTAADV